MPVLFTRSFKTAILSRYLYVAKKNLTLKFDINKTDMEKVG